jgi:peptidoglycan/xylan/chitin deacetylase (PgdA/CDA1 family)
MASRQIPPLFIISLDFELFWGMVGATDLTTYGENIRGVHTAIPKILDTFRRYDIHATWATVGMLMARDKRELESILPPSQMRPSYKEESLSTYAHVLHGAVGEHDQHYFAPSLVSLIAKTPHQEIGSHTFAHYYALEDQGNIAEHFRADCAAMERSRALLGLEGAPQSLVFPRNQVRESLLEVAHAEGIRAYRGNPNHVLYKARRTESRLMRAVRLIDAYIPLSGHHTHNLAALNDKKDGPVTIPASRFLRPVSRFRLFESLRLLRITRAMTMAAKRAEAFHLWWHPHNFGIRQDENILYLQNILEHYKKLSSAYGMRSVTMAEAAEFV